MTFYDALKRAYVGKTIRTIVQKNAPTFLPEVSASFVGKKITKVWINVDNLEDQRIMFEVEGIDYPLALYFHENIELG